MTPDTQDALEARAAAREATRARHATVRADRDVMAAQRPDTRWERFGMIRLRTFGIVFLCGLPIATAAGGLVGWWIQAR